jgi:hypothetical protein
MSLDDLYEIMSWPIGELDPFRLSVRITAGFRAVDKSRVRLAAGSLRRSAIGARMLAAGFARFEPCEPALFLEESCSGGLDHEPPSKSDLSLWPDRSSGVAFHRIGERWHHNSLFESRGRV